MDYFVSLLNAVEIRNDLALYRLLLHLYQIHMTLNERRVLDVGSLLLFKIL